MDWYEEAIPLRQQGKSYNYIADFLNIPLKTVQSRFKRDELRGSVNTKQEKPKESIQEAILKDLQKPCKYEDLCKKHKASERIIKAAIEDIQEQGYIITEYGGTLKLCKDVITEDNIHDEVWDGTNIIRFGVVSDNHLGSKYQQITHLNRLYDIFEEEGISTVYNSGDLTEGFKMRPGHEHEIFLHGADEQTQYVIEKYPKRSGIITKFITGNHDHSHIKNGGTDIGKPIAKARPDMIYLGLANAKVYITPNCIVELNHPLDGAAYALSYAPQKTIDSMHGGEKPNILLNGHHHKAFYMCYRNIHAYECATTQAQTPWMRGKRIAANMGGWIIEVEVNTRGDIERCKGEYIPFYRSIEHDY